MDITKSQSFTCRLLILLLLGVFSIRAIAQKHVDASPIKEEIEDVIVKYVQFDQGADFRKLLLKNHRILNS